MSFNNETQLWKITGGALLEKYKIMSIVKKVHEGNVSPVDIVQELKDCNYAYILHFLTKMEETFEEKKINPVQELARLNPKPPETPPG